MALFTQPVQVVGPINMFARATADGQQVLACNFRYTAEAEFTLILPLPTPPDASAQAVRFIDLSNYDGFFGDLRRGFPDLTREAEKVSLTDRIREKVLDWLDIDTTQAEITFAPNRAALLHIAEQFKLSAEVQQALARFQQDGFVCLKLAAGSNRLPPLAFEFPRRAPESVFFPTAHSVGGQFDPQASFNYTLFCQSPHRSLKWRVAADDNFRPLTAREFMKPDKAHGLIDPADGLLMQRLRGPFENVDICVPEA